MRDRYLPTLYLSPHSLHGLRFHAQYTITGGKRGTANSLLQEGRGEGRRRELIGRGFCTLKKLITEIHGGYKFLKGK